MEKIGLDVTLSANELEFLTKCKELKDFKLQNEGKNPRMRSQNNDERILNRFLCNARLRHKSSRESYTRFLQNPKLRRAFEAVERIPDTSAKKKVSDGALRQRRSRLRKKGIDPDTGLPIPEHEE